MNNTLTIARRQLLSYFNSPVAYVSVAIVLGFTSMFFWWTFFLRGHASVRELFEYMTYLFYLTVPAITMGLIAEEKRSGTIELLITMPVRDWEVIVGKFLAALVLIAIILGFSLTTPLSVSQLGTSFDWGPVLTGYLGMFLAGAAIVAFGLLLSSWMNNQIVAFFLSFAIGACFAILDFFLPLLPNASVFEYVSIGYHLRSMARGVIDSRDIVYFLSVIGLCLGGAFLALDARRWR